MYAGAKASFEESAKLEKRREELAPGGWRITESQSRSGELVTETALQAVG